MSFCFLAMMLAIVVSSAAPCGWDGRLGVHRDLAPPTVEVKAEAAAAASAIAEECRQCAIPPRSHENIAALVEQGFATSNAVRLTDIFGAPPATTSGVLADETVVREVTATIEEEIACINAGEFLRMTALWSDRLLLQLFSGIGGSGLVSDSAAFTDELRRLATPVPVAREDWASLESVHDVRVLDNGRVTAITRVNDSENLVVFVKSGDGYLIDARFAAPFEGTPTP